MDLGWKRVHLLIFSVLLKHAVGYEGWISQNVQPQTWSVHKLFSPREVQSSVLEAPVTGSIPVEEVASNMFAGKSPNASRPLFSLSRQYVKGGFSSSYGSISHTQSVLDRISSVLQLQGSSSPNAHNVFNQSASGQGSYSQSVLSPPYGSGLQRVSAQLASTPVRGDGSSGLSILSKLSFSPLDVSESPTGDQSSSNMSTTSTQSSSGLQLGGTSSLLSAPTSSSTGSSSSSRRLFTSTYQGSSGSQLAGGSSQLVSASGFFTQSPSSENQDTPGSSYAKLAASPLGFSQFTTDQSSYSKYTPSSESSVAKVPVYSQAAPSGSSLSLIPPSQGPPSSRWSQSFQTSGTVASQSSSPSQGSKSPNRLSTLAVSPGQFASKQEGSGRYSVLPIQSQSTSSQYSPGSFAYAKLAASPLGVSQLTGGQSSSSQYTSSSQSRADTQLAGSSHHAPMPSSTFTDGSFLQLQGTSSPYAPAALDSKVPVYSQAAPSATSALIQTALWGPSISKWSQGSQTSGAVASQSSSPSQGFKAPSKFSTLTSVASPSQFASKQEGSGRYSGLSSLFQSASSPYSPGSPAYIKRGSSLLDVSRQSASGQSTYSKYTSSSQSRAGTPLAGSSPYAPVQSVSTSTDGSSLQLQGTSSPYAPAALDSKVPVYSQAAPSASSALIQTALWGPSISKWSQGSQTSGAVASQSSSPSQGFKAPSKFSTLTSAASPSQFASKWKGSNRYSGLPIQSQSTSSQYSPGSSGYAKLAASSLGVRQSTSGPTSYSQYISGSLSRAGPQLAGSSHHAPMQTGSTFTGGSSLQLHGTSSPYAPPALDSKVPVYSQAAPSASSALSQTSLWEPSTSRWSQGFQTSGVVASQSSSPPQGSKAPSKFSTFTSGASPSQFASKQEGSGRYSGLSSLFQSASSPYSPGSPAYIKRGSSLLDVSRQSASGQSTYSKYTSSSQSRAGTQLAGSNPYVPVQSISTSTDGSSLQLLGPSASVHNPSDSMTSSLGSSVQGASQGIFSGQSSDSTSVISSGYGSTYGQKPSVYSKSSQSSSATGRYFSSVKG